MNAKVTEVLEHIKANNWNASHDDDDDGMGIRNLQELSASE